MTLAELCSYVADIHVPVKIAEAFDFVSNKNFYFVDFGSLDQALDVLDIVNSASAEMGISAELVR